MRRVLVGLVSAIGFWAMAVAACGSDDTSGAVADDGGTDAHVVREAGVPDTYVPYVPVGKQCHNTPYPDAGSGGLDPIVPDGGDTDAGDDAGTPTDDDGGYDAGPPLGPPQGVSYGGPILANPRVVPITYSGDYYADQIEDFVGSIGCTDYWRQVVSEYGVGQLETLTPVRLTDEAPAAINDSQIGAYIKNQIKAGAPGFVNYPKDVIFAFYFPTTTTISLFGEESCQSFDGYHSSVRLPDGTYVAYAVMARCSDTIDELTGTSTHEFVEASTDPNPDTNAAYLMPDDDHIAFSFSAGGELGDLCTFYSDADYIPDDYFFTVQRTWSNKSIAAGHNPCVPAVPGGYVAAIPDQPDTIGIKNAGPATTRGIAIPIGGTRTIEVHTKTDNPAITSWTISANDTSKFTEGTSHLALQLDSTTATPDGVVHLTITRNSKGQIYGAEPFSLHSK
ncbi:MAG TPA: hypothetical protein VF407_06815, partial [Polyangiaceae bacterium]